MTRPGFLTSEFVLTLLVVVVAGAAALIQVWRGQLDGMGALGLMSAALATTGYSFGRARIKSETNGSNGNGKQ